MSDLPIPRPCTACGKVHERRKIAPLPRVVEFDACDICGEPVYADQKHSLIWSPVKRIGCHYNCLVKCERG